ncbi:MAG TPA: YetF domain-containing protein [Lysobacter sp.]
MDLMPDRWLDVWAIETPLLELLLRAAVLYLGILFILRIVPRRTGGELATMDLVLILLVTECASHALGDYASLGDGLVMILAVMGLNYAVNALSYRFRWIERLVSAPPIPIIVDGRLLRRNMRREFITDEELESHLRRHDIDDLARVRHAYVEGEGQITFVTRERPGD